MLALAIDLLDIYITDPVLEIFDRFGVASPGKGESGGILLGQIDTHEQRIMICRASVPGPLDQATSVSFVRGKASAQQIIEYEFHNSNGTNTYLGEWHSHPAAKAQPSTQDLRMIRDQRLSSTIHVRFLLLIVVAKREICVAIDDGERVSSTVVRKDTYAPILDRL